MTATFGMAAVFLPTPLLTPIQLLIQTEMDKAVPLQPLLVEISQTLFYTRT